MTLGEHVEAIVTAVAQGEGWTNEGFATAIRELRRRAEIERRRDAWLDRDPENNSVTLYRKAKGEYEVHLHDKYDDLVADAESAAEHDALDLCLKDRNG